MRPTIHPGLRSLYLLFRHHTISKFGLLVALGALITTAIAPTSVLRAASIPPQINKSFVAYTPRGGSNVINPGEVAKLAIRLFNSNTFDLTNAAFTDNMPTGMVIANLPNIQFDAVACGAGTTVTATAGASSFSVSGATIPASGGSTAGECDLSVDVTSTQQGNLVNTIGTGALTALDNTAATVSNTSPASATLAVNTMAALTASKQVAGSSGSTFYTGHTGVVSININNNDNSISLTNLAFDDDFANVTSGGPLGGGGTVTATDLAVASSPNASLSADCGTTAVFTPLPGDTALHISGVTIAPKKTCTVQVTVTQTTIGVFYNNILQNNITDTQGVTNSTGAISAIYSVQKNTLDVTKAFGATQIDPFVDTTMTVTLKNPNPFDDATGVTLNDVLPAGLVVNTPIVIGTNASLTNCGGTAALSFDGPSNTLSLTNATVAHNNASTCTFSVTVHATTSNVVLKNDIHSSDVSGGPGFSGTDTGGGIAATASLTINGLHVTKTYSGMSNYTIFVNGTSTLQILFTNPLSTALTGVTLTDTIGPNVRVAATPNASSTCSNVTFNPVAGDTTLTATFDVAASASCSVQVDVTSPTANTNGYVNNLPLNSNLTVGGGANPVYHPATSATLVVVPVGGGGVSAPVVGKTFASGSPAPGANDRLTITIQAPEASPGGDLTNVNLSDALPAGMVISNNPNLTTTNCTGGTFSAPAGGTAITWTNGSITGGTTCTIRVNVYVQTNGTYTNTINNTGAAPGNFVNAQNVTDGAVHNAQVVSVAVNASSNFQIGKTFSPSTINTNGGSSTLTISITAPANLSLTNVTFSDPLDSRLVPGTPAMSAACSGPAPTIVAPNTLSWSGGTVAAGQTCNITVTVTAPNVGGNITNAMAAGAVTAFFGSTTNAGSNGNSVSVRLGVTGLAIAKKFQPSTIGLGGVTTLVLDFTNSASIPLTGLTFTDDLGATMGNHVVIYTPSHKHWTCGTDTDINAPSGSTILSVTNGTVPAAVGGTPGTCTLSVDVTTNPANLPVVPGSDTNILRATNVTTNEGIVPINDATALLNYQNLKLTVTKQFSPNNVTSGTPSNLIVLLKNPQSVDLAGITFSDNLPTGMFIAANGATFDAGCGGTPTATGVTLNSTAFSISGVNVAANTTCTITIVASQNVATTLTNTILGSNVTATSGIQTPQDTQASLTYTAFLGVNKSFSASSTLSDKPVTLNIQFVNAYPNTLTVQSFTDDLTAAGGLKVAPTPNVVNPCGLTVGATAGSSSITVTGGTLPANSTCTVSVDVVGNALQTYTNRINAGDVVTLNPSGNTIRNAAGTSASVTVTGYYLGNRVWRDDGAAGTGIGNDGIINGNETTQGIDGVTVTLLGSDGATPYTDGSGHSQVTTSGGGYYRFDSLPAGTYFVRIDGANWTGGATPLRGLVSSAGDFNSIQNTTTTADLHDMGIDATGFITNGIKSGAINLSYTTIPASESDTAGTRNGTADSAIPDAQANLTVDFGFVPGYNIGNRVWLDNGAGGGTANDGIINGSEATQGISGVTVTLLDSTGTTPITDGFGNSQVTTDANGYYRFDGLPAGLYLVRIDSGNFGSGQPLFDTISSTGDFNGTQNTTTTADLHDMGVDSTTYLTNGILSDVINLSPTTVPTGESDTGGTRNGTADSALIDGQTNLTVDFGFLPGFSIGNRIWRDDSFGAGTGNDGILNGAEVGISGVTVTLLDSTGTTPVTDGSGHSQVTTDANGYYRFDGLLPNTYRVRIDASNWTAGAQPLANLVSSTGDFNGTQNTTTTADSHDMGVDSASYLTNGILSSAIVLSDAAPTIPLGESDKGGTRNGVADTALLDARSNLTVDFGFVPTYSVGNRVWRDDGGGLAANLTQYDNGRIDATESGIGAVTLYLYRSDAAGTPLSTTPDQTVQTTATGYYRFDGLIPGTPTTPVYYVVAVDTSLTASANLRGLAASDVRFTDLTNDNENMVKQSLTIGTVKAIVSPPFSFSTNAVTTETDVPGGLGSASLDAHGPNGDAYDNLTIDFGFFPAYSIGNRVWYDTNNNGRLDFGESPVPGVTVDLLDSTGAAVLDSSNNPMQVLTDATGYYRFDGLRAGDYFVQVDRSNWSTGPLVGYASSTNNITQAGPATPDSFDNGVDNNTPATNGIRSTKITVGLNNQPTGEDSAGPTGTGAPSVDSANNVTGDAGDAYNNLTLDFGFYRLTVGDTVWNDNGAGGGTANDGIQNGTEPGISGVIVQLYKGGVLVAQQTTNPSGQYLFNQQTDNTGTPNGNPLVVGSDYTIVIPKAQAALNTYSSSTDISSTFNPTATGNGVDRDDNGTGTSNATTADTTSNAFTLNVFGSLNTAGAVLQSAATAVTHNPTLDFGFHTTTTTAFSIGNRVFLDNGAGGGTANNGVQDGAETGIDGVRVLLYNVDTATNQPTTLVQTQMTSSGGYYRFDNVPAGPYMVIVDRNNSPVLSGMITSNNTYTDYTAAGDRQNKGSQTPLALGSPVPNGVPSTIITTPVTPAVTGEPDVNNGIPPAANGPNGDALDLLTVDFGFYLPPSTTYSIGNRVWLDNGNGGPLSSANDGIQNGNEAGIANVTMRLYNADGAGLPTGPALATQTTDATGYYRFDNVGTGSYVVVVDTASAALSGLTPSTPVSADYAVTGDQYNKGTAIVAPITGVTSARIVIPPAAAVTGEPDVTATGQGAHSAAGDSNDLLVVDFGFHANPATSYSIGNRVWLDDGTGGGTANDGIQNGGETGLSLVPVRLFAADASGTPIGSALQSTNTDASGYYRFDGVTPGNYVVVVDLVNFNSSSATKYRVTGTSFTAFNTASDQQNKGEQTLLDASTPLPGGIVSPLLTIPQAAPVLTESDIAASGAGTHGPSGDTNDVLTADFGLVVIPGGTFSIGNRVFLDNGAGGTANNGIQESGEAGIPNVTVRLYANSGGAPSGAPLQTTTTDASGYYRFDSVAAGQYIVVVDTSSASLSGLLPSATVFTDYSSAGDKQNKGTAITVPITGVASGVINTANAAATLGEPDVVGGGAGAHGPLGDNTDILTADFGFFANPATAYSIGNRVWFDNGTGGGTANDGIQNGAEPGIPNVRLDLFFANASGAPLGAVPLATTISSAPNPAVPGDTGGYYRFDGITLGNYVVVVDKAGSSVLNGFTPSTPTFTDFSTVGDQHNKGTLPPLTQTSPVPGGIVSSLITLPQAAPVLLEPDVDLVNPPATTQAAHGPNGDALDALSVDFGFAPAPSTFSVGNRVWSDLDRDGKQSNSEPGIGGVKLWLYRADASAVPTALVGGVVTDAQGFYRFDGLTAGDYVVLLDQAGSAALNGWTLTQTLVTAPNANTTDALNNGLSTSSVPGGISSGKISLGARPSEPLGELVPTSDTPGSVFTLGASPQSSDDRGNLTIDFGFVPPSGGTWVFDPVMVKLVDPALALPGETVTFTITVNNQGNAVVNNVIVTDPVPDRLIIKSVHTPQGSYQINGNTITFSLGTMGGGQTVTLTVTAQIRPNVVPPADIGNTATANLNGKILSATANVHVTGGTLPNTGEHPDEQQLPLAPVFGIVTLAVCAGVVLMRRRQMQ